MSLGQGDANVGFIDFDGSASDVFAFVKFPMKVRVVTCEAFAVSCDQGVKAAAATTEPVIAIAHGTADLTTAAPGTEIAEITCNGAGAVGKKWSGTTTPTTVDKDCELSVYLKTAGSSATSGNIDGGCVPVLWFAIINAP